MTSTPARLTLKTHRDRRNWWQSPWIRRVLLVVPALLVVLGLANVFGQRPTTTSAATSMARLTVDAPTHGRSGLIYAAHFRIEAIEQLKDARLIIDPGWADGYTVNGVTPQPLTQGSSNGRLNFGFGHVPASHQLDFWLSLQINPTSVGHHSQRVSLYDGRTQVVTIRRAIFIFP
jgi:hypothetical protein